MVGQSPAFSWKMLDPKNILFTIQHELIQEAVMHIHLN